jgi:tRNA-Thr(GGU) m(6)t(6)A37 methyltransferase TsaA
MSIQFTPIGTIHTPHKTKEGMPIQPKAAKGIKGHVEVFTEFAAGLKDLGLFSHIYVLYYFHESKGYNLEVKPFLDHKLRGLFATRAPRRPNGIGLSIVKLIQVKDNILEIENVDMLDGTPLLDIKPYVPKFDIFSGASHGWLADKTSDLSNAESDKRFSR